ncbi:MAG: hypothetical protein JSV50_11690 [Desulfobacteraceae bacterium]|nr:MAG: hypothetical protein JSV50_11690 [Desulfobacteraceae bacterium]
MNNKIYIPATKPEDWKRFLAKPTHWGYDHSAMSLAYCWQEADGCPATVSEVFNKSEYKLFHDIEILLAIPEHQVPLPPDRTSPSQNDLFVLAKSADQLISITVDGKSLESFGKLVSVWKTTPGKEKRLIFLCNVLGLQQSQVLDIGYQLIHRTVSALLEAKRFTATNALMLVHSFKENAESLKDFQKFASLFGIEAEPNAINKADTLGGIDLYLGWVNDHNTYGFETKGKESIKGIVTARKCEHCGHHELGITTESDEYVSLKPGMKIEIRASDEEI